MMVLPRLRLAACLMGCCLVAAPLVNAWAASPTLDVDAVMPLSEYARVRHDSPYRFHASGTGWAITYLGVRHSRSDSDETALAIAQQLAQELPTLVLVEGPVPASARTAAEASRIGGEAGLVAHLAVARGLRVDSLEQSFASQVLGVQLRFGADAAAVFYGLRIVAQERARGQGAFDLNAFLSSRLLAWLRREQLTTSLIDAATFCQLADRVTGRPHSCLETAPGWFDPLRGTGPPLFEQIATTLVRERDRAMVMRMVAAASAGERIFAVAGHSHVVMQEPALRRALGCNAPTQLSAYWASPSIAECQR